MTTDGTTGEPAVANGRVFQGNQPDASIAAYDAKGKTNCTVKAPFTVPTCEPLSRYVMVGSGAVTPSGLFGQAQTPTGTGGRVAAADPSGCTEAVCPTMWTSDISDSLSGHLATDGSTVLAPTAEGNLVAFSASGCGAAACTPLWTATTSSGGLLSPSIANGVVYAGGVEDGRVYAFDAAGCGTTACSPIWQSAPGAHIFTTPAIALGTVYIGRADGTLTAYRVPPQPARNRR
jgi:outer membrane protein assembly factor BamB